MNTYIVDYGTCNLGSIRQAIDKIGFDTKIVSNPRSLHDVDKIVLPGVGNFSQASFEMQSKGWFDEIKEHVLHRKRYILGICLGMQMFASTGEEGRQSEGFRCSAALLPWAWTATDTPLGEAAMFHA